MNRRHQTEEKEIRYIELDEIAGTGSVTEIRHLPRHDATMKELFRGTQKECHAFLSGVNYMANRILEEEGEKDLAS